MSHKREQREGFGNFTLVAHENSLWRLQMNFGDKRLKMTFCFRPDQRDYTSLEDVHDEQKRLSHRKYNYTFFRISQILCRKEHRCICRRNSFVSNINAI